MSVVVRRVLSVCLAACVLSAGLVGTAHGATTPSPVTGLAATTTSSSATLTWNKANYATSYRVCLQEYADQDPCFRQSSATTKRTVTFNSLKPTSGTDYYFKVYAYNGSRRSTSWRKGFNLKPPPAPSRVSRMSRSTTSSTATISWSAAAYAQEYSVCLMADTPNDPCLQESPRSATRQATFTDLTPTEGTDYFYRILAYNDQGSSRSFSHTVNLPVGDIESITVSRQDGTSRVRNQWSEATNAAKYELQFATSSAMTSGLQTYTVSGPSATLTKLIRGTTYYYRVRAINESVKGAYTPVEQFRLESDPTTLVVITYNLCGQDKCVTSSNGMKKWTTRRSRAGSIARATKASIIATQESHSKDTRFDRELPGFGLAAYYSAKSLFYDKAKYDVLRRGVMTLNRAERKYAVWAEFRDRGTRTAFIVVDAHLQPYKGKVNDDKRGFQTRALLRKVDAVNTADLSVVYAGDFNSNKSNLSYRDGYDAPLDEFTKAGIPDAFDTALSLVNSTWNSSNQARNPPTKHSDHIDHIFVTPEILVRQWKVIVSLNGRDYATPFATDHNPVRTTLTIPGR